MVSRRNFFSIIAMMLVILFLFMMPQLVKQFSGQYEVNDFMEKELPSGEVFEMKDTEKEVLSDTEMAKTVRLFTENNELKQWIGEWALYTKRNLIAASSIGGTESFEAEDGALPPFVIVDTELLIKEYEDSNDGGAADEAAVLSVLKGWLQKGVSVVMTSIPDETILREHEDLKTFFGIRDIKYRSVNLNRLYLFDGFILGGEYIFTEYPDDVEVRMDMDLKKPWYVTDVGSKVYMIGYPENVKQNASGDPIEYPALIWRVKQDQAFVFVFDGSLFTKETAGGFLQAAEFEMSEVQLYPVVNAACLTAANALILSDENREGMKERYSRTSGVFFRDVFLPAVRSILGQTGLTADFMLTPSLSYEDSGKIDDELYHFYLEEIKEMGTEAGYSFENRAGLSETEKLQKDEAFLDEQKYNFTAAFMTEEMDPEAAISDALELRTISKERKDGELLLHYTENGLTVQGVTDNVFHHSCMEQLGLMCRATALGYSNILFNVDQVIFPEGEEADGWEELSDYASRNLYTYFRPYTCFDALTLTESDYRVRNFLNLDYSYSISETKDLESSISIQVENSTDAWFILRAHDQSIGEMHGLSAVELQKNAWLLHIESEEASVELAPYAVQPDRP